MLIDKLQKKNATIGVIGLGYVGLPLSITFAKAGFKVIGIDNNIEKVSNLNNGCTKLEDVDQDNLQKLVTSGFFKATYDYSVIQDVDVVIICVPTPLNTHQQPDITYITSVVDQLKLYLSKNTLVVLESTTYPGTTEELIQYPLEQIGFKVGTDVYLCFSPERIDPGNKSFSIDNTPKVVGGITNDCLEVGKSLYENIIKDVLPVSSTRVAEMSKLLENTFRSVNIAFINEMAIMCDTLKIDIWEVIKASSTKPFGYMPFYPGPGIGGHCIPLDPMYLSWKARGNNFFSRFIETAQEINKGMPKYVTNKISEIMNANNMCINQSKILLLGMSYKPNIGDYRESPSLDIYHLLNELGSEVHVNEPYCEHIVDKNNNTIKNTPLVYEELGHYDCVVILTPHAVYNPALLDKYAKIIVDTRNIMDGIVSNKVYTIGKSIQKREMSLAK